MDWFASALPIKPICRFLLNRYLGEILLEKVNLEQLSVDVLNGTGSISDVNLDVQHINQSLHKNSVPFELVDGFIGYISVHIPFSKLLQDSCTIEITGLELTLQPKPCRSTDLVSSMIESVIGSMTTSMDLAKSFVEEQNNGASASDVDQFQGIDALAQIIQIILSRMKINFKDTIIRLEHFPSSNQDTGVALELRIERIEFVDEVVDVAPNSNDEPITEQPQSSTFVNSPVQDISKIVKLHGVRFYTDIFMKPEGAFCKSVVFRRKNNESVHVGVENLIEASCSSDSSVYKSCYSSGGVGRSTIINGEFTSSTSSSNGGFESNSLLPSKPVQFAQFTSDELRLRVRLKNSTMTVDGFKHDEVDIELFLGALTVFLTPTQFYLIAEIAKSLLIKGDSSTADHATKGGKPMLDDDFAKVEMDLRRKIDENRLPTSFLKPDGFQTGNWSGDDKFYHSSKTPWKMKIEEDAEFTSIPMSFVEENGPDLLQTNQNRNRLHSTSNGDPIWNRKTSSCDRPETSRCKICLASFLLVLTHDDPLNGSTSAANNSESSTTNLINSVEKFFDVVQKVSFGHGSRLQDVRKVCDDAYPKDHLRFIACPLILEYTQNKQDNMQICLTSRKAEFMECLFDESSSNAASNRSPTRIEILRFEEIDENLDHPDIYLRFGTEDKQNYVCTIELNRCSMEIDISLVDRLNNLLFCQPSFKSMRSFQNRYLFEVPKADLGLRDDWFEPLDDRTPSTFTCALDVFCSCFTINFRIPVPDLRPSAAVDRSPWWIQRVRDDVLRLKLERVTFKTIFCENIAKSGNFVIEFSKGTVYFVEADKQEPTKLLHVFEDNEQTCGFEFKWDFVNRSLFDDRLQDCSSTRSNESLVNSLERNCFKISSNLDGPFSKKHVVHENEQLTIVGSRSEMKEFRRKCLKYCETGIHLRLPGCRFFLPDKQFYELLYNRLCNDLAFWTPSSPGFQNCTHNGVGVDPYNVWVTGLGLEQEHFAPCKSAKKADESDSDSESTLKSSMFGTSFGAKRKGPHKFSCLLQCGSMDLMMFLTDKSSTPSAPKLRFTARNGEIFFVYGYENDENTSYFYLTSETASLKHAPENLNLVVVDDVVTDVESKDFARNQDWMNTAEPTPPNLALKSEKDDNFSLALRLVLHPKENVKEFLITLGIRNSTLHYRTIPTDQFWLTQLISFFNVVDYPVLGFDPPKVINEIHVHAWNLVVQYKPEKLPYALRCYVDSLDVSTNIVQEAAMFRFHIILEDSSLFVTDKARTAADVAYNLSLRDYVCLMKMGFFELILTNFEPPADDDVERQRPLLEIHVHNDSLEIRTCPDSFAVLTSILKYLAIGGDVKATTESNENNSDASSYNEETNVPTSSNDCDTTEERLRDLMASAMEEAVLPPPKAPPRAKNERARVKTASSSSSASSSSRKTSGGAEDFLILDEVTGTGIRSKSGEPRVRSLTNDLLNIVDNHIAPPLRRTDPLTSLPNGYPLPLLQYFIRDFTIVWHLYGGNDFGDVMEQKPYSRMCEAQHTPKLRQRFNEAKRNIYACGGPNRDHSVHAELFLNKMCLLYELYPPGNAQAARQILTVQDVEIRDHLFVSSINKLLYRHTTEQKPKQTYLPMFCVKMLHFVPDSGEIQGDGECCLKISVLPLRLNIDQDTLLFLSDFGKEFGQLSSSVAVANVKRPSSTSSLPGVRLSQTHLDDDFYSKREQTSTDVDSNKPPASINVPIFETPPPLNDLLFDDLPPPPTSNGIDKKTFDIFDEPPPLTPDDDLDGNMQSFKNNGRRNRAISNCSVKSDSSEFKQNSVQASSVNECGYYFKSFVFSPAVELKLDYHGKRLQLEQGALPGLLLGLSQLHATELKLKELHYRHGLLGFEKVMAYAINEWLNDIRRNQMYNIVGGVGPVHTLLQVSQGIVDLFWLPVDQYRRDGHIVKGFQRGAQSFGVSTASAALELSQRLVGTLQGVAEFAFDIVNPEYPPKSNGDLLQGLLQPYDFREGVHMACATVRRGFSETAEAITLATQEEKARGRWVIRGVLRQATPTVLRPFVVVSQATTHILGGLRNQLRPDSWREEQDKWKNE